jgi:F-type H+-transporting ATPase subunit gamma
MPNLKLLASRIKSTKSTSKITKAMKMVAASKLRGAESKMLAARPFVSSIQGVMESILTPADDYVPESKTVLAVSSDKGMCGGINSKIVKEIKLMDSFQGSTKDPSATLLLVGGKARDGLARTHATHIDVSIDEAYGGPVTFSLASFLGEQMLASSSDTYTILYNKFKSVIAFDPTPLTLKGPEVLGESGVFDEFEFEGEKEEILANMYQFNIACSLYGCLLENVTSEQASRMTAMDSATNNANEMISKLTIIYNRQRQAVITTELTEIVAGAESV